MNKQTETALKMAIEALEKNKRTHHYCEDTWYSCPKHEEGCADDREGDECNCGADRINAEFDKTIQACKEALEQEQSFAEKTAQMSFMSLWDAYTTLKMKLEALEQPQCNPHPKAPHGFNRDASHSADRYVCDCEGWDAWEDGYDEGLRRGLEL